MAKVSDFAVMADSLREIREELAELRAHIFQPGHRDHIRSRADPKENPDPTPIEIPGAFQTPETIQEIVQKYIRQGMSVSKEAETLGTFHEEDDFTEDDHDELPTSLFEVTDYEMEPDPEMPETEDASDLSEPAADEDPPPAEPETPAPDSTDSAKT